MNDSPSISFPVAITLRVIGRNHGDFPALLVELVGRHVRGVDEADVVMRPSRDGNYVSVLVPVQLESKAQLDAVYRELNEHEAVIMVL